MGNFIKLVLLIVVTLYSFGMICCLRNSSSDLFLDNTETSETNGTNRSNGSNGSNGSNRSNGSNENNDNVPDNEKTQDKLFEERIDKLLAILFCLCLFIGGNIEMLFSWKVILRQLRK